MNMLFLLTALLIFLPFQVALNPATGIDLASVRIIIPALFLLWLGNGLKNRKLIIPSSLQSALVLGFLFLNFFSLFFARNIGWGVRKLAFFLSIFPIYFVTAGIIRNKSDFRRIAAAAVASGAAAAIVGIFQFMAQFFVGIDALYSFWSKYIAIIFLGKTFSASVIEYPSWLVNISGHTYFRAVSIFPDPHMFALFLGLIGPLAVALFLDNRKKVWLICATVIFLADALTFSRGGYVGLFAGAVSTFFIFQGKLIQRYKISLIAGVFIFASIFIIPNPISTRFYSSFNVIEGSNAGRLVMWRTAGENILEHPFVGLGIGNFPLAVDPLATYREPIYAHSTYLDIAVEAGLWASIAFAGLLLVSIREFLKKAKQSKLFLGAAVALIIFSAHSLVETGLYSPVVLTLLLVILAGSHISHENEKTY